MPPPATTPELLALVRKAGVARADTLDELTRTPLPDDPTKAAGLLVTRRLLTEFQAKLLLVGRYKGFRLGPYILTDLLGQGGMGAVYRAEHEVLRRPVAVKVLADARDPLVRERFHREARAAATLDHPNIVRTHDISQEGNTHYIVMEFVDGRTLDKVLGDGPLSVTDAVDAAAQAAVGLQHASERGFLHRDIKPANLIRATDGTVKILDMGLARSSAATDDVTAKLDHGAVVGTADYISPEQAMNDPKIDIRSDIYSLGASLFALLAGRPPFEGNTVSKLAQHQLKPPPLDLLKGIAPPGLVKVVAKMLSKKPADRYRTPADVVTALEPWLTDRPALMAGILATDAGASGRFSRPTEPRGQSGLGWKPVVIAVVAAVAVGVALAVAFAGGTQQKTDVPVVPLLPPPAVVPPVPPPAVPEPPPPAYRFDFADLKGFRVSKGMGRTDPPMPHPLPKGVDFLAWKPGATGLFTAERIDGRWALGVANNTDLRTAQFSFHWEGGMGVALVPGSKYALTVEYRSTNGGSGGIAVQTLKFKTLHAKSLPDTAGEWKTVELKFERGDEPLRATFDNNSLGTDDAPAWLHLRRFELTPVK